MKTNLTNILLTVVIVFLSWSTFFKKGVTIEPVPVTITIPETSGTTDTVRLEPEVKIVKVYVDNNKNPIEVDSTYKALYEKTTDSIKRLNLYLEAIKVQKYSDTLVNDENVMISGDITVRGTLLDYKIDYVRKDLSLTYTPEVVTQLPRLSVGFGVEVGVPTIPTENMLLKAEMFFMNRKGNAISISYDSDNRIALGYKKTLKLIK